MKRFIFYFISLLIFPINANALTGMELYNWCKADEGSADLSLCLTHLNGYVDGTNIGASLAYTDMGLSKKEIVNKRILCTPDNATIGQLRLMFNKYAQDNPKELNENAGWILTNAIKTGFCKNKE